MRKKSCIPLLANFTCERYNFPKKKKLQEANVNKIYIPNGYHTPLNVYDMQMAIEFIKHNFQRELAHALRG